MDDLEFRRALFADPTSNDPALQKAKNSSPARQKVSQEMDKLDQQIASALNVDVPDDLCDRLILRQTLASHQQNKRKTRIHLALAASVALVIGLSVNVLMFSNAYTNIADYALAHTYHEADHFSNEEQTLVSLASLNDKMASFDGSFSQDMGELLFADYCRFDGMKSLHLVYRGLSQPVNVYIVPDSEHLQFSANFSDKNLKGQTIKFNGKNIIVVGDKSEPLKQWQETISNNVQWST